MGNCVQEIPEGVGTNSVYRFAGKAVHNLQLTPHPNFLNATECKGGMHLFRALEIAPPQLAREDKMIRHLRDEALM